MEMALLISNIALWAVVIILIMFNLLLLRQVGVLFERVAPAGALATNALLAKDAPIARRVERSLAGGETIIGGAHAAGKSQLLFFAAPDCPVCKSLLPALRSLVSEQASATELIIVSAGGDLAEHHAFVQAENLQQFDYIISDQLGMQMGVAKLPYAVLIAPNGLVSSFGLVNSREHLESLFEAQERGVVSLQDYMGKQARSPQPSKVDTPRFANERRAI